MSDGDDTTITLANVLRRHFWSERDAKEACSDLLSALAEHMAATDPNNPRRAALVTAADTVKHYEMDGMMFPSRK